MVLSPPSSSRVTRNFNAAAGRSLNFNIIAYKKTVRLSRHQHVHERTNHHRLRVVIATTLASRFSTATVSGTSSTSSSQTPAAPARYSGFGLWGSTAVTGEQKSDRSQQTQRRHRDRRRQLQALPRPRFHRLYSSNRRARSPHLLRSRRLTEPQPSRCVEDRARPKVDNRDRLATCRWKTRCVLNRTNRNNQVTAFTIFSV